MSLPGVPEQWATDLEAKHGVPHPSECPITENAGLRPPVELNHESPLKITPSPLQRGLQPPLRTTTVRTDSAPPA